MELCDKRKAGFTLTLEFEGYLSENVLRILLNDSLFSSIDFRSEILYSQLAGDQKAVIVFDSTVNLFDVIQSINCEQIRISTHGYNSTYKVVGMEIIMNDTKLSVLELLPSHNSPFFVLKILWKYLEDFGLIFAMSRDKKGCVCTGIIRALMILKDESKIPEANGHGVFKIVPYLPYMFEKWIDKTTEKFYDDFCSYVENKQMAAEDDNND